MGLWGLSGRGWKHKALMRRKHKALMKKKKKKKKHRQSRVCCGCELLTHVNLNSMGVYFPSTFRFTCVSSSQPQHTRLSVFFFFFFFFIRALCFLLSSTRACVLGCLLQHPSGVLMPVLCPERGRLLHAGWLWSLFMICSLQSASSASP